LLEQRAVGSQEVLTHQALDVPEAADQRHLRDRALDALVDRAQHQYVATAVAGTPHPDAARVDLRAGLRPGDRVAIVACLGPWIDLLAWLPVAGTEVAVVEHKCPKPCGGERLRISVEVHLLDGGKAVGHDDGGNRIGGPIGQV